MQHRIKPLHVSFSVYLNDGDTFMKNPTEVTINIQNLLLVIEHVDLIAKNIYYQVP